MAGTTLELFKHAALGSLWLLDPVIIHQQGQQKILQLAMAVTLHAAGQSTHLILKFQNCPLQALPHMEGQHSLPHVVITGRPARQRLCSGHLNCMPPAFQTICQKSGQQCLHQERALYGKMHTNDQGIAGLQCFQAKLDGSHQGIRKASSRQKERVSTCQVLTCRQQWHPGSCQWRSELAAAVEPLPGTLHGEGRLVWQHWTMQRWHLWPL